MVSYPLATPIYRLRDLCVDRAGRRVLDVPALELTPGRVTAVVGPNGAGKTTLLRVLALLLAPTSGTLEFDGHPINFGDGEMLRLRQQVTFIAQSPLLFHRSVAANVAYGLRARGRPDAQRVAAALAAVGLDGFGARPAWKLSGGETQRVAIARALAIDPAVYLFDEPTANVDREHVRVIEALIQQLGAAGKTVLLTAHNVDQAYRVSDAVLSLVGGRVTSAPLVNVLRGTTSRHGDAAYFDTDGLRIEIAADATPHTIAIDPQDIIISRAPLHSSARNSFVGQIIKVEHEGTGIMVTVACGQPSARPLVARITRHSYDELALNIGAAVWVTFKATAIHVLGE